MTMARGLAAVALLTAVAATAAAEPEHILVKSRADKIDPAALMPLLKRGELALVDGSAEGPWQVIMLAVIDAPPERVFEVVNDVERYPDFIDTVASIKVTRRGAAMFAYKWELDIPLLSYSGTRLQRARRPDLVEVRGASGSFRGSTERWELRAVDGGKRTLATFYRTLDLDSAGVVLQTMAKLEPSFIQAATLGTSYVHVRGLQYRLRGEKAPRPAARKGPVPEFRALDLEGAGLDLARLEPLLGLGPLVLVESYDDGALRQVTVLSTVDAPRDAVAKIVREVERYPEFMKNFAEQTATKVNDRQWDLAWELEVPFANLHGTSRMTVEPTGAVEVINNGGDLPRARFRWEVIALGDKRSVPIHYAYSDVRQASFFTKLIVDKQPLFEHGAVIAAATIAMQAVDARAEGRR